MSDTRPRLLDLFCCAGGASMGYHLAGFEVAGVDIKPQKRYPFTFIQGDALAYVAAHGHEYDAIHASPPCQAYSVLKHLSNGTHPDLVDATRDALQDTGKPYVIENVVGAPLRWPLLLCGSMFGLQTPCGAQLRRHRLFESNILLMSPSHCQHGNQTIMVAGHDYHDGKVRHHNRQAISVHGGKARDRSKNRTITVTGSTPQQNVERNWIRDSFSIEEARIAMGIDWMVMQELSQAIPPAYAQWVGQQLQQHLTRKATP
jgi:DNA (cytosine-5)-methyltransferase 1